MNWKTSNHNLPIFPIRKADGSRFEISDGSIALTKNTIKVGDTLQKTSKGDYCLVNGVKTQFPRYLGEDSVLGVVDYVYNEFKTEGLIE